MKLTQNMIDWLKFALDHHGHGPAGFPSATHKALVDRGLVRGDDVFHRLTLKGRIFARDLFVEALAGDPAGQLVEAIENNSGVCRVLALPSQTELRDAIQYTIDQSHCCVSEISD